MSPNMWHDSVVLVQWWNDMKHEEWWWMTTEMTMTWNRMIGWKMKNLVLAVHVALAAACWTPSQNAPLVWPEVLFYSIYSTQNCMYMYITLPNFVKPYTGPFKHTKNIPRPPVLSCLGLFSHVFMLWVYPAKWRGHLWSWNSLLGGSLSPTTTSLSSFQIHFSCNWSQQGGVWPTTLIRSGAT